MKSVFLDINVILDIFLQRPPFYQPAALLFSAVEVKKFRGYLCALSYPTLFYILQKQLKREKAITILEKIRTVLRTAPVTEKVIDLSLSSNFRDFEDAVQYYSCIEQMRSARNTKHQRLAHAGYSDSKSAGFPGAPVVRNTRRH